jgi:hypothetical protein
LPRCCLRATLAMVGSHALRARTFMLGGILVNVNARPPRNENTYQLAVEPTCVAVELIVQSSTPKWRMSGTAIGTLGFDASRSIVSTIYARLGERRRRVGHGRTGARGTCRGALSAYAERGP